MTSRYVYTWKFVKNEKGDMEHTIRLRLVLRGFMDLKAFDVETFSGTARLPSQRLPASTAACKKQWVIASLGINMAFLTGLTYQELAEATGEEERVVVRALRRVEALLAVPQPGTGTKDAPRAFLLKLRRTTRGCGIRPTFYDEEFETSSNLLTAKHADDTNMASTEDTSDKCVKCMEDTS
eukprot:9468085-Pyramimonas_sp.AAC.3